MSVVEALFQAAAEKAEVEKAVEKVAADKARSSVLKRQQRRDVVA